MLLELDDELLDEFELELLLEFELLFEDELLLELLFELLDEFELLFEFEFDPPLRGAPHLFVIERFLKVTLSSDVSPWPTMSTGRVAALKLPLPA